MNKFEEVANSMAGSGIKVFLKDGTFEEFKNHEEVFFIARVNNQVWVGDRAEVQVFRFGLIQILDLVSGIINSPVL